MQHELIETSGGVVVVYFTTSNELYALSGPTNRFESRVSNERIKINYVL